MVYFSDLGGFLEKKNELLDISSYDYSSHFYWLSYIMVVIFRFNNGVKMSDYGDFTPLFKIINDPEIEKLFIKIISNTINKMKDINEEFDLYDFVKILNNILNIFELKEIEINYQEISLSVNNIENTHTPYKNNINLKSENSNILNIINNQIPNFLYRTGSNNFKTNNLEIIKPLVGYNDNNSYQYKNFFLNSIGSANYNELSNKKFFMMNGVNNFSKPDVNQYYEYLVSNFFSSHQNQSLNFGNYGNLNLILMLLNKQIKQNKDNNPEVNINEKNNNLGKKRIGSNLTLKTQNESSSDNSQIKKIQSVKKIKKNKDSHSNFMEEKSIPIKGELEKYLPFYENEKNELCSNIHHNFMKNHFPEGYRIDNFYIHIKTRKDKWNKRKNEYLVNIKTDFTMFQNILKERTIDIRENEMIKVWSPHLLSQTEG